MALLACFAKAWLGERLGCGGDYPEFRPHNATSEGEPAGVKLKFYKVP
jgi:hypothetical protein